LNHDGILDRCSFETAASLARVHTSRPAILNHSPEDDCTPTNIGSLIADNILSARLIAFASARIAELPFKCHAADVKHSNDIRPS